MVHLSGEGWAWGLAQEDLRHVDVKIALIPWDRLDELRSRAAVHQQPKSAVPRHGDGLPSVVLYGTDGKMARTIAWLRDEGFAGIRPTRRGQGATLAITSWGRGPFPEFTFGRNAAGDAVRRFRSWTRSSGGAHALVIFDSGIEAQRPELIPGLFEAAAVPHLRRVSRT